LTDTSLYSYVRWSVYCAVRTARLKGRCRAMSEAFSRQPLTA